MNKSLIVVMAISMVGISYADNKWTGFYAGVNAGFSLSNAQLKSQQLGFTNPGNTCNKNEDFATLSSGLQLGYLYPFPNRLVAGIEANIIFNANQNDTLRCKSDFNPNVYDRFILKNQRQLSIRGRVGYPLSCYKNILPYLVAGANFANIGLTYKNEGGDYFSHDATQVGGLIGAGIEWAFMQHWSLRVEYDYVDYANATHLKIPTVYGLVDPNGYARVNLNSNDIFLAVNYWIE